MNPEVIRDSILVLAPRFVLCLPCLGMLSNAVMNPLAYVSIFRCLGILGYPSTSFGMVQ